MTGNAIGVGIVLRSNNVAVQRQTGGLAGQGPSTVGLDLAIATVGGQVRHLQSGQTYLLLLSSKSSHLFGYFLKSRPVSDVKSLTWTWMGRPKNTSGTRGKIHKSAYMPDNQI